LVLADVHRFDRYPLNWPDDPHRWLSPPNVLRAWIAETAPAAVIGHVAVHQATSAADRAAMTTVEVSRLFIAPTARRHGVAIKLLGHVRQWATWTTPDGRPVRLRRYTLSHEATEQIP
jgi:GNAT superfamily N-acetyltransferase